MSLTICETHFFSLRELAAKLEAAPAPGKGQWRNFVAASGIALPHPSHGAMQYPHVAVALQLPHCNIILISMSEVNSTSKARIR
jgi:hypothetical protein